MKKHILNGKMLLLLCILLVSCVKEMSFDALQTSREREKVFFVDFDDGTKSFRDENGHNGFSTGDTIRYFGNASKEVRTSLIQDDGTIRCLLAEEDTVITAVYGGVGVSVKGTNSFCIANTANDIDIQDGNFSSAQKCVAYANIEKNELIFQNINSIIKFRLERNDVDKILLFANNGDFICGTETNVYHNNNNTSSYLNWNTNTSFIPIKAKAKKEYFVTLSPQSIYGGITIELFGADGNFLGAIRTNKTIDIRRNEIVNLGTLDEKITFDDAIYQVSDEEGYSYFNRYGLFVTVKESPSFTMCKYETSICHDGKVINVYSDNDGLIRGMAINEDIYDFQYDNSKEKLKINKIISEDDGQLQVINISEGTNPNYNKVFPSPDYSTYEGMLSSQKLTRYKIIAPAIHLIHNLPSLLSGNHIIELANMINGTAFSSDDIFNKAIAIAGLYKQEFDLWYYLNTVEPKGWKDFAKCLGKGIWDAVEWITDICDMVHDTMIETQNIYARRYDGVVPITLGVETLSETSVKLSCAVNGYSAALRVGIILGDGNSVLFNHRDCLQRHSVELEEYQSEYSMVFTGLQSGKRYRYQAYIVDELKDGILADYCLYSTEIKEFTLMHAVEMSDGVEWATCNAGAQHPWEKGTKYTSRAKLLEDFAGWRIPTRDEWSQLKAHSQSRTFMEINGVPGWEFNYEGNSIFIPIYSTNGYGDFFCCYYITGTKHKDFGSWCELSLRNNYTYDIFMFDYSGGYQDNIGYSSLIRLVRDK